MKPGIVWHGRIDEQPVKFNLDFDTSMLEDSSHNRRRSGNEPVEQEAQVLEFIREIKGIPWDTDTRNPCWYFIQTDSRTNSRMEN